MDNSLKLLDIITILSFILQLQNQQQIINIKDIQTEVDRAIDEIHSHLARQDEKIDKILELIQNLKNQS